MPKLGEIEALPNSDLGAAIRALPVVKEGQDVFMLWSTGHYDGPRSGVCLYQGKEHRFDTLHDGGGVRIYGILEITEEQLAGERLCGDLYVKYMGDGCSYTYKDGRRIRGQNDHSKTTEAEREANWKRYCEETKAWSYSARNYSQNEVLARWSCGQIDWDQVLFDILRPDLDGDDDD